MIFQFIIVIDLIFTLLNLVFVLYRVFHHFGILCPPNDSIHICDKYLLFSVIGIVLLIVLNTMKNKC